MFSNVIFFLVNVILCVNISYCQGPTVGKTVCYCSDDAHHMKNIGFDCINNVCKRKNPSDTCYTSADEDGNLKKGCMLFLRCYDKGKSAHSGEFFHCCDDDMCNENLTRTDMKFFPLHPDEYSSKDKKVVIVPSSPTTTDSTTTNKSKVSGKYIVMISVPCSLILLIATLIVCFVSKQKKKKERKYLMEQENLMLSEVGNEIDNINLRDFTTSGSGAGLPLLVQRTIARQIELHECIGAGRFGAVHRGSWHGQDVAVKIFSTNEEASWFREAQIYQTTMLRHENVLGFIAADNKDTGTCTQLWLVTEYHAMGSVYDFLQDNTITPQEMIKMVFSIVNGLAHLHMEVIGTQGKPAMAHRDVKTKNILVKNNKTCSIADLGLTVLHTSINNKVDMPTSTRTGTRRYQPPEILEDKINLRHFDAYRRADVYALGLCIWEIGRRTTVQEHCEEYQLPYFDCVKPDPSHEEMRQAVCVENKRPTFPKYWHEDETMKSFLRLMKECWYEDSAARLTTLRIKKNILALCKDLEIKL